MIYEGWDGEGDYEPPFAVGTRIRASRAGTVVVATVTTTEGLFPDVYELEGDLRLDLRGWDVEALGPAEPRLPGRTPPTVRLSLVGVMPHHADAEWPDGWPVPDVGAHVCVGASIDPPWLYVRAVDWYPTGGEEGEEGPPFVVVVLGPTPRGGR